VQVGGGCAGWDRRLGSDAFPPFFSFFFFSFGAWFCLAGTKYRLTAGATTATLMNCADNVSLWLIFWLRNEVMADDEGWLDWSEELVPCGCRKRELV